MTTTRKNTDNGHEDKTVLTLFWVSITWTTFQIVMLLGVTLWGGKELPSYFTSAWLMVLGTYATKKRVHRWGKSVRNVRRGELLVYLMWGTTAFLFGWYIFVPGTVVLSDQLLDSFGGITAIFFGSEMVKSVDKNRQEKRNVHTKAE
jgi:hypothetical protein